jgi:hypothetical protein
MQFCRPPSLVNVSHISAGTMGIDRFFDRHISDKTPYDVIPPSSISKFIALLLLPLTILGMAFDLSSPLASAEHRGDLLAAQSA